MNSTISRRGLTEVDADVLIVPVFEGESPNDGTLGELNALTDGAVAEVFETGELAGQPDRWALIHTRGRLGSRRLMLCLSGSPDGRLAVGLQRTAGAAVRTAAARGSKSAAVLLRAEAGTAGARATVEGAMLGVINGDIYRTNSDGAREIERLSFVLEPEAAPARERAARVGVVMAEATNLARALGNEPGNVMTPSELAARAQLMAAREGLPVQVLDEAELKQLGMGALLAVSRGSDEPARLIVLRYEPPDPGAGSDQELIALVGKGITFDSGGISIKSADKMDEMKFDMGGGAAVIGAMQVIARLKPSTRVLGLVPAAENLPSGRAVKPGDVVRSMSGKTVEVVNTDAEGRLILCDAISYAISKGATAIVDAATLTGACVVALGEVRAGVMGTDQRLVDELIEAGEGCGERLWQLPLDSEYRDIIRSDIADIKNVGNRTAGAITAAMFLCSFTGSAAWAHLDIAGTAWLEQEKPYMAKGATGFGVRLLANFVLNRPRIGA